MLFNLFISVINRVIQGVAVAVTWVLGILPDSPFASFEYSDVSPAVKYLTYFVPVHSMIVHFGAFLGILVGYYAIRVVLNWLKVLEG